MPIVAADRAGEIVPEIVAEIPECNRELQNVRLHTTPQDGPESAAESRRERRRA